MAPHNGGSMKPHQSAAPSSSHDDDGEAGKDFAKSRCNSRGGGVVTRNSAKENNDNGVTRNSARGATADDAAPTSRRSIDKSHSRSSDADDVHHDIYAQLEQFEHSLDVELEDLEKLGIMEHEHDSSNDVTSSSDDIENDVNSDAGSSVCSEDDERMTLMLMPPPSAWFQLDDHYMKNINSDSENNHDEHYEHYENNTLANKQESKVEQQASGIAADESTALLADKQHQQQQHHESENLPLSVVVDKLPKLNSPDAHMFDLTPLPTQPTQHSDHDGSDTIVSQLTLPTTASTLTTTTSTTTLTAAAASISTSLETLLTQTLPRTLSQTIPLMMHEYSTSALQKSVHKLRVEYTNKGPRKYVRASDIGNSCGGYYLPPNFEDEDSDDEDDEDDDDIHVYSSNCNSNSKDDANTNANIGGGHVNDAHKTPTTNSNNTTSGMDYDDDVSDDVNDDVVPRIKTVASLGNYTKSSSDHHLDCRMRAADGTEVRFTTLPWIEKQMVHEWRTYEWQTSSSLGTMHHSSESSFERDDDADNDDDGKENKPQTEQTDEDEEEDDFDTTIYAQARTLAPRPLPRPQWENASTCYSCNQLFGPTLHRHHCRRCGHSYCNSHSNVTHKLPHLGYDGDVPERVCRSCKGTLDARDLEERVSWRLARCRDFVRGDLTPYFETGVDTVEDAAYRLTRLAISLARSIPLGAQAYVAIETVEVLRKHGLKGVYGLLLRKEFLAAADLLCRVLGINKMNWPLSVHELSAAIFYALAQHRALRGVRPDGEEVMHSLKRRTSSDDMEVLSNVGQQKSSGGKLLAASKKHRSRKAGEVCERRAASTLAVVKENQTEEENEVKEPKYDVEAGDASSMNYSNEQQEEEEEEDDEAGDTIVWEGSSNQKYLSTGEFSSSILDETDVYDPTSEKVVDVLAMSASKSTHNSMRSSSDKQNKDNVAHSEEEKTADAHDGVIPEDSNKTDSPFDPVCEHVPDSLISSLLFYAPLALDFIYAECEVDMQLLAAQQGWRLVYASLDQNHHHANDDGSSSTNKGGSPSSLEGNEHFSDRPASALFAHDKHKIACLSIRGTATIQDVVTDIRAMPVPFPEEEEEEIEDQVDSERNDAGHNKNNKECHEEDWTSVFLRSNGLALCGMAGAASNLFCETADSLLYLAMRGYKIRIVGHSLGGGVAALLGILVVRHFERQRQSRNLNINNDGFVKVYGYGTPSCVDAKLADHPRTLGLVTSVVLHDDVVPRLTPTSVRGLLKHLLYIRETWVKTHLSDDLNAITERAYHVWPTRLRGSFTLLKKKGADSARRLKKSCSKRINGQKEASVSSSASAAQTNNSANASANASATICTTYGEMSDADTNPSIDDEGVDVEGDLFFDPLDDPLNESDDESSIGQRHNDASVSPGDDGECDIDWVPFDEPPMESKSNDDNISTNIKALPSTGDKKTQNQTRLVGDATPPQILEELPLPRMFIPGRIVHVYTHRGGYKAAFVPRKFRSLRRISMAGNMLSDHMAKSYYEGLLEVKAIRAVKQDLPPWVGFADDATCACCASLFTWASTSNTEAQAARDKHNCRACGGLVCDPCSKKRVPIPAIGITAPVRVCDRCYNGWGTLYGDAGDYADEEDKDASVEEGVRGAVASIAESQLPRKSNKRVERMSTRTANSRRSAVVDELASRIPSISN